MPTRSIILHYHLFKNSGTSIDDILQSHFMGQWTSREFDSSAPVAKTRVEQAEWVQHENKAIYFTSHTAVLPPPALPDLNVIPIIFFRHPIDRIASVYYFERSQNSPGYGPEMAKALSFRDYLEKRMDIDWQVRNFHTTFLTKMFLDEEREDLQLAKQALDILPFYGIVEDFSNSMMRLSRLLVETGFCGLSKYESYQNVNRDISKPLDLRLEEIASELGTDFYNKLIEINKEDLDLYKYAVNKLE